MRRHRHAGRGDHAMRPELVERRRQGQGVGSESGDARHLAERGDPRLAIPRAVALGDGEDRVEARAVAPARRPGARRAGCRGAAARAPGGGAPPPARGRSPPARTPPRRRAGRPDAGGSCRRDRRRGRSGAPARRVRYGTPRRPANRGRRLTPRAGRAPRAGSPRTTGSGWRRTPKRARTPSRTRRATRTTSAARAPSRATIASVWRVEMPAGAVHVAAREPGSLDEPRGRELHALPARLRPPRHAPDPRRRPRCAPPPPPGPPGSRRRSRSFAGSGPAESRTIDFARRTASTLSRTSARVGRAIPRAARCRSSSA